jgi:hypothetical protein
MVFTIEDAASFVAAVAIFDVVSRRVLVAAPPPVVPKAL